MFFTLRARKKDTVSYVLVQQSDIRCCLQGCFPLNELYLCTKYLSTVIMRMVANLKTVSLKIMKTLTITTQVHEYFHKRLLFKQKTGHFQKNKQSSTT